MRYKLPEQLHASARDGKYVFVDSNSGAWARTNHVGYETIIRCDGARDVGSIVDGVAELYGVPGELIRPDIETFLKDAVHEGIVLCDEDAGPAGDLPQDPNTVWFHVTRRCNLNCVHCYAGGNVRLDNELSIDEINGILAQIAKISPYMVYVTGGEPLMRTDLARLDPHGLRLRLVTNGVLVSESNCDLLAEKFSEVQVSVDGPDAATHRLVRPNGDFAATMRALDLLTHVHFEQRIVSCTATRLNKDRIPEMVRWTYDRGWSFFLSRLVPTGNATMELYLDPLEYGDLVQSCRAAYSEIKRSNAQLAFPFFFQAACTPYNRVLLKSKRPNCGIGGVVISIDASGDVYPCPLLHVPGLKIGSLQESSFSELVSQAQARFNCTSVDDLDDCRDCYIRRICGGGCRAMAFHTGHGLEGHDPYCSVMRQVIEAAFWLG